MKEKTILYLNVRQTVHEAKAALLAAKRIGYHILLLSDKPQPILDNYVDHVEVTDTYDINKSLDVVHQLQKKFPFDGVVTWGDRDVELMAAISERYNLPGPSILSAKNARNKYRMREALKELKDLLPRYHRVTDVNSLEAAIQYVGFPAVIKPTGASGSKGIFEVRDVGEAKKSFSLLREITNPNQDKIFSYSGSELIFEEYLDGNEFSVEGLVCNNEIIIVGITDKETTQDYHIEFQHIFPSSQNEERQKIIIKNTKIIVEKLNLNNCAFHLEAKWTSNGFKLVEIAARIGGDYITSHLIPLATNINFYEQLLKIIAGDEPKLNVSYVQHVGMRSLLAKNSGKLVSISEINTALINPNILHIFQEQPFHKMLTLPPNNFSLLRVATLIAQGYSHKNVLETLTSLSNHCQVITENNIPAELNIC